MKKRYLVIALTLAVLGGGVAGSLLNTSAYASSSNNKVEMSEKQEQQKLEKEAVLSKEEALTAALKEVKGKAANVELEDENGTVVYGVKVIDEQGKKHDVKVDAKTGKFLKIENDDEDDSESDNE